MSEKETLTISYISKAAVATSIAMAGMGAVAKKASLALALCKLERLLPEEDIDPSVFLNKSLERASA